MALSPQELAERCTEPHWAADDASHWIGMRMRSVGPGQAVLEMDVAPHHLNGHAICHGGFIFALADSAFAYACNSHNRRAVAQHNTISFIAPARLGDRLTATAREITLSGRSGVYDVEVRRGDGALIALFRGCSRTVRGTHIPEEFQEVQEDNS